MNHYYGAMDIANAFGEAMGGKGKVAILNAPPGIIIRDQRTNGFIDGLKQHYPDIELVADQVAAWDRKKARDVLTTILAAHPDLGGVYGVNQGLPVHLLSQFTTFGAPPPRHLAHEKKAHQIETRFHQRRRITAAPRSRPSTSFASTAAGRNTSSSAEPLSMTRTTLTHGWPRMPANPHRLLREAVRPCATNF